MSRSVNMAILVGHLGKDAETKFTPSGIAKVTFSLATTRRYQKNEEWVEETDWHNVTIWRAEKLANYLTKGKQVYVQGRISNRSYEQDGVKKYFTEVVADTVNLLGGNGDGEKKQGGGQKPSESGGFDPSGGFNDDDAPF